MFPEKKTGNVLNLKDSYSKSLKKFLVCVMLLRRVVWVVDLGVEHLLRQGFTGYIG